MRHRLWAAFLTVCLTAAFLPRIAVAENPPALPYLCEDYEDGTGELTAVKAVAALSSGGAGDSRGALKVTVRQDLGCARYQLQMIPDQIYQMSVWIKTDVPLLLDNLHFIFQSPFTEGAGFGYIDVAVKNAGLKTGEWVQVQTRMLFDGMGTKTGSGGQRFPVTGEGSLEIRLGDGTIAGTSGGALVYEMDDLCVLLVKSSGNLVLDGDFETNGYEAAWTVSGADVSQAMGADGTGHSLAVEVNGDWGSIRQMVPVRFGMGYRISFWAKTDREEWAGKPIQVILDRTAGKTDANVPSYEYRQDPLNKTITTEWTKYEMVYQNGMSTSDPVLPTLYFRVGDGKERVRFLVDEVQVTETGDGHFSGITAALSGNASIGQTVTAAVSFKTGLKDRYFYRVLRQHDGRWVTLQSGETTRDAIAYTCRESDIGSRLRFEVTGIDAAGSCTNTVNLLSSAVRDADVVASKFEQMVWNDDLPGVSAVVEVQNRTADKEVLSSLALYDRTGRMLDCGSEIRQLPRGGEARWRVEVSNDPAAETAKLFVWEKGTLAPMCQIVELKRAEDGQLLYLDAKDGSDQNDGSFDAPLQTMLGAQKQVRRLLGTVSGDIYVILKVPTARPARSNCPTRTPPGPNGWYISPIIVKIRLSSAAGRRSQRRLSSAMKRRESTARQSEQGCRPDSCLSMASGRSGPAATALCQGRSTQRITRH